MSDLEIIELALRRVADREERRWETHGTVHTLKIELLREIAAELVAIKMDIARAPKTEPTP